MTLRRPERRRTVPFATLPLGALLAASGCDDPAPAPGGPGSGGTTAPAGVPPAAGGALTAAQEVTLLREMAAAHYDEAALLEGGVGFQRAAEILESICARPDSEARDLVALACAKLKLHPDSPEAQAAETPKIRELCRRALERDPKSAAAHFVQGVIAWDREQDAAGGKAAFEATLALLPDDLPTRLRLAEVSFELGERDRAIELYTSVHAKGREFAGAFYMPTIYRLARVLRQRKQVDAAAGIDDVKRAGELLAEHKALREAKAPDPGDDELKLGTLARVLPPRMTGIAGVAPASAPALRFTPHAALSPAGLELLDFAVADLDSDLVDEVLLLARTGSAAPELHVARQAAGGTLSSAPFALPVPLPAGIAQLTVVDLENAFGQCLLFRGGGEWRLFTPDPAGSGGYVDATAQLPPLPADVRAIAPVDFGHDGHVDLAVASADGMKLVRNDGVPKDEYSDARTGPLQLIDASAAAAGLLPEGADWVTIEDFDGDQDIDLLVGGAGRRTILYSSLRRGRFEAQLTDRHGLPDGLASAPLLADLDHDATPDALVGGAPPALYRNDGSGRFRDPSPQAELAALWHGTPRLADLDLDGELDFVGMDAAGVVTVRYGALTVAGPIARLDVTAQPGAPLHLIDHDADGDFDLVTRTAAGVALFCNEVPAGRSLVLELRGQKDNRQAVGAIVELRSGARYGRWLQRGSRWVGGLGGGKADLVRMTWPNGVVQYLMDPQPEPDPEKRPPVRACAAGGGVAAKVHLSVLQKEGLAGSCPFLYTWNGTTYEFISDVLGTTPLGLPMTDELDVPPDHDELVRVEGRQLAAQDGEYRLQVTEELREVTYLDRAQLWVIDHPADVEVHPEERFCFPPFPPQKIHTVKGALPVAAAVDQEGRDWAAELAAIDGAHAVPFKPRDSRYLGLVTNHSLELALPEAVRAAPKVRLLLTGWLLWTDASVNVAAARNGSFGFVPPTFAVPDGQGGWRDCGPPVGFPAGKTKTMVVDVTSMLNRADLRLRVSSSIRLYWDAITVAVDADDAPITVTRLEPKSARLWHRGFSAPIADVRPDQPERYDWDRKEPQARWNQHYGSLTRFGDVVPLLGAIDDRFAIFSAGDAIDLRFDATTTPLRPGLARTYLVYVDGWAKDADPNTKLSQTVEPLPFHGMSGYPYRADEHYPTDDAHLDYQLEWNTRAGTRLVPALNVLPSPAAAPARAAATADPVGANSPAVVPTAGS